MDAADDELQAMLAANLERLQFVLLATLDSEYGRSIVEDELDELDLRLEQPHMEQQPAVVLPAKSKSAKRKRFDRCEQCERDFDVTANGHDHCVWHSGYLMINSEEGYWCGAAEDIDTQENRQEFPEAFVWSCCNEQSDAEGCLIGYHKAGTASQKKYRS
ncbi:uncharacterized protein BKCO1_4000201 [Diplodia corticola]|uniref:C2H2-type domain-containing protein n=1 Tax=Diplodia corticola TaxID=236234 RepID=A0A1J9SGI1_9PEZI|nr:uncharacterized protein BKCO1_4000201 [Diplodia corticola]OJD38693.1 hypothetical protein BKCO1_4000201 [Diplodia corticola]